VNPELEQILTRAQILYDDVDYKAVAEWKSRTPERKAIGYMPILSRGN
jgi:benzoyl-CoA reductase subunit C